MRCLEQWLYIEITKKANPPPFLHYFPSVLFHSNWKFIFQDLFKSLLNKVLWPPFLIWKQLTYCFIFLEGGEKGRLNWIAFCKWPLFDFFVCLFLLGKKLLDPSISNFTRPRLIYPGSWINMHMVCSLAPSFDSVHLCWGLEFYDIKDFWVILMPGIFFFFFF